MGRFSELTTAKIREASKRLEEKEKALEKEIRDIDGQRNALREEREATRQKLREVQEERDNFEWHFHRRLWQVNLKDAKMLEDEYRLLRIEFSPTTCHLRKKRSIRVVFELLENASAGLGKELEKGQEFGFEGYAMQGGGRASEPVILKGEQVRFIGKFHDEASGIASEIFETFDDWLRGA